MTKRRERSAYYKAYDATHREERREKDAKYHAANRDSVLARSRARYAEKREADLARKRARRRANPDEGREYRVAYYAANTEKILASCRDSRLKHQDTRLAWREKHKERLKKYAAEWARANAGLKQAAFARRFAARLQATPAWADRTAVKAFYVEANRKTRATGIKHEVDHIYPLKSHLVCGLHCEANLQILTKTENRRKWNRLIA